MEATDIGWSARSAYVGNRLFQMNPQQAVRDRVVTNPFWRHQFYYIGVVQLAEPQSPKLHVARSSRASYANKKKIKKGYVQIN